VRPVSDHAAMSDPDCSVQFRRHWQPPPGTGKGNAPAWQRRGASEDHQMNMLDTTAHALLERQCQRQRAAWGLL
jgi:hypothetical protein